MNGRFLDDYSAGLLPSKIESDVSDEKSTPDPTGC